jgi:hypothetical protein
MEEARYLTDDRDLREERQRELIIYQGGNGDWYVSVDTVGSMGMNAVRLCTSGGASSRVPGLTAAIAQAYRAIRGEPYESSDMQMARQALKWAQSIAERLTRHN